MNAPIERPSVETVAWLWVSDFDAAWATARAIAGEQRCQIIPADTGIIPVLGSAPP